jgi:two-component system, NarL family, response regulator DesR
VIKVVLVEELRLLRGALAALVERDPEITVVDGLGWSTPIVSRTAELRPDVVILNTDLVGQAVSTAIDVEQRAACRCLILFDPRRPILLSVARGVRLPSFVAQDAPPEVLPTAVRRVAAGELVLDPRVVSAARMVADSPLSRRELEVLALAAEGVPIPEIAARLAISPGTVRNCLSAVVAKTRARNRLDAIRISRVRGWL